MYIENYAIKKTTMKSVTVPSLDNILDVVIKYFGFFFKDQP